ncbi:hypothetical protein DFP73DRAFT_267543 [Morchella snyderi]|nr:hypothetical protein DFP73DRAFT_267543 [Morchella snyderi]
MAFNFNWTPLTTSSTTSSAFYTHAKSLLTAALNKSQKPPIIVDDIFVEELNLGQSAPDLEILEIGDLAEDRFRGIFRMSYEGDASLTLKTKVQANPLNTYLSTTPSFTSPTPLAASAPLTIPLQITLSDFRLSGFIILVFSKAKGITLVFRNDPLESLKVSSTFDSIPFIKDYLQKEIERQVRGLFQEELPVAVHRLSLRLWNPEYAASLGLDSPAPNSEETAGSEEDEETAAAFGTNPLLSPTDSESDSPSISFSQKNLAALKELSCSQKTLSVGTPSIPDVVFRAWASGNGSAAFGGDKTPASLEPPGTPMSGNSSTYTFSENGDAVSTTGSSSSRPSMYHTNSSPSLAGAAGRTRGKRRKHRVVNLRSQPATPLSEETAPAVVTEKEPSTQDEVTTPTALKRGGVRFIDPVARPVTPTEAPKTVPITLIAPPSPASSVSTENITYPETASSTSALSSSSLSTEASPSKSYVNEKRPQLRAGVAHGSGILEKAFLMKLAGEMQRRLEEERKRRGEGADMWQVERELRELGREAPPAYGM